MLWFFGNKKNKRHEQKSSSVTDYTRSKNQEVSARSIALKELDSRKDHSPVERFNLLANTYRDKHDCLVVPESWQTSEGHKDGFAAQQAFLGVKIFVDTPFPSIVRTR